ncbi:LysR family transcriptional regulator [Chromobacterium vaccinii]|uniref:LysR family transcriptional regulator n=1 Tax=Chromobacterium vaccinii TaxID=1108595 RepID=A0A1D9LDI2_9NEIS|nr:LysR family transcriptional regulator [Chromobacterium vaccinii]AOZ49329.1 LysR family transcriptional regulator [Chromobacterium vaccinii]QND84783.1 LysR family transcriptional regulator [Chromobacterium vaccinii]QND90014.1 LysR family transcriptional regulator [Chromobacterium vaccinii]SUX53775.1 D-malate degradation protein R [Chromobacterium vaccinii]
MPFDRLADLRLFQDASLLGSFSAAGRKHGLSPAAASACIQRMEAALGARLFQRTTRRLRLTEAGETYLTYCRQALELLEEGEHRLQQEQRELSGVIRLSAPSDLGRNQLLGCLDRFGAEHPAVHFSLSLSDTPADLIGDDIDLAIRYGQPADSSLVARQLAASRRVVCAAPALLERLGMPSHPQDLAALPTLTLMTGHGPMNEWRYRDMGEARTLRLERARQSNDGEVLRRWAVQGLGFAYKSQLDIAADLAAGRLATVLDDYFTEPAPLHLLYPGHRLQPARIRRLVDFLLAEFSR